MLVSQQALNAILCSLARQRRTPRWLVCDRETGVVIAESHLSRPWPSDPGLVVVWAGERPHRPRTDNQRADWARWQRERRARAIAHGMCSQCKRTESKPGCRYCVECLSKNYEIKERYRASGRCWCGNESRPGRVTCEPCAVRQRKYQAKRRAA